MLLLRRLFLFNLVVLIETCAWFSYHWEGWSSCSESCGGGTRRRTEYSCVKHDRGDTQTQGCNENCYHGHRYSGGKCQCPLWRSGRCCETCRHIYIANCSPGQKRCGGSPDNIMCTKCLDPYYSDGYGKGCKECPVISNCKHRHCTSPGNNRCMKCTDGYVNMLNNTKCEDINECAAEKVSCQQLCKNTPGSFVCECRSGYRLKLNGVSCEDVDECERFNGGCSHVCKNSLGSFECLCPAGYILDEDKKICKDINECAFVPSKCQHTCYNVPGSYKCGCRDGFKITGDDQTCENIDDCASINCMHGGQCIDGVRSATCNCPAGYTGNLCEKDIDECKGFLKGGCDEICINTFGSFRCACSGNKTLAENGFLCDGGGHELSVFASQHIPGLVLPRGCSTFKIASCTKRKQLSLLLSSTSPWYQLKSNTSIIYTLGIVFVEVDSFALPVSMKGAEVTSLNKEFSLTIGSLMHNATDGRQTGFTKKDKSACWSFNITARYIHDFLQSMSFMRSVLNNIERNLPKWMALSLEGTELFGVRDLKTEFLHGYNIEKDAWCEGAPVFHDRLYSVFKFGGKFSMKIYGNSVTLPNALSGQKYCFIVDICQDTGGTIFLMLPKESRKFLENFEFFKQFSEKHSLHIQPRGIGISVKGHVKVKMHSTELELWNGDQLFNYNVMKEANLWIGGDVSLDVDPFYFHATADLNIKIPAVDSLLTSLFKEEWALMVQTDLGADLRIKFRVLKTDIHFNLKDIGVASLDIYASLGGQTARKLCGDGSNPPGFFFSAMAEVNPFKDVPILQDWIFDFTVKMYIFVTSNPGSAITADDKIDIFSDIIELERLLNEFLNLTMTVADHYGVILTNETISVLQDLEYSINNALEIVHGLMKTARDNVLNLINNNWQQIATSFETLWSKFKSLISADTNRFCDSVEFQTNVTKHKFINLFKSELGKVETNLKKTADKLLKQVFHAVNNYKGFGFRFSADLKIIGFKFGLFDIEAVYSVDHLGSCGKFQDVFNLFKDEKAFRFFGKASVPYKLGPFLRLNIGAGLGLALGIESDKFQTQVHVEASLLGIHASADLFLNNNNLYFIVAGDLWGFFKARLKISATHEKIQSQEWDMLALRVHGELLADGDGDKDFYDSYLDALRRAIQKLADAATKRLSQAQNALSTAQSGLISAQDWLESRKKNLRALNSKFDDAIRVLDRAKDKLEEAKGPFRSAISKLNEAQRNVDHLCRIEHCHKVCIPGMKCKICHTGGWIHFPYPCCHFTSCMISFPNPICVAKNLACRAIRGVAYAALEAAKIFVRIPMLALDAAKLAVSAAQFVVDKSRIVLDIAIAGFDVAKLALEGAKGVLEAAKLAIESIKQVMELGFKVVDMIIHYGLQNLVDLKNCQFDVEITTKDLPVFSVSCQVNALRLGWREVKFGINFNRPLQSLWQAAKSVIKLITDSIGHLLLGRKRRDLLHESVLRTHEAFRLARDIDPDLQLDEIQLNETIDIVFETAGSNNGTTSDDYDNRVWVFQEKCERYKKTFSFLYDANAILYEIANETTTMLNSVSRMHSDIEDLDLDKIRSNFTLKNAGINPDVALRDYNITEDELNSILSNTSASLSYDPIMMESSTMKNLSKELIENSTSTISNVQIIDQWLFAMNDVSADYYPNETCVSFLDCAHYSIAELLDVYYAEDFDNISDIVDVLSDIEDTFLELVGNSSLGIKTVYNLTNTIGKLLNQLDKLNPVCSSAPVFLEPLKNLTVVRSKNITIVCNVTGDPEPKIWWFVNGEVVEGEYGRTILLTNVSESTNKTYMCIAGNVVANLSSGVIFLDIEDDFVIDEKHDKENEVNDTKYTESGKRPPDNEEKTQGGDSEEGESKPILNRDNDNGDMVKVLSVTISCIVAVAAVGGIVVWRVHVRKRFRKNDKMGSFLNMGMVRPSAANMKFSTGDGSRAITPIDALQ